MPGTTYKKLTHIKQNTYYLVSGANLKVMKTNKTKKTLTVNFISLKPANPAIKAIEDRVITSADVAEMKRKQSTIGFKVKTFFKSLFKKN